MEGSTSLIASLTLFWDVTERVAGTGIPWPAKRDPVACGRSPLLGGLSFENTGHKRRREANLRQRRKERPRRVGFPEARQPVGSPTGARVSREEARRRRAQGLTETPRRKSDFSREGSSFQVRNRVPLNGEAGRKKNNRLWMIL